MTDNIDPTKKAAILAAVVAFMGKRQAGMFLRDCRDSGAWGKLSRIPLCGSRGYRSGSPSRKG